MNTVKKMLLLACIAHSGAYAMQGAGLGPQHLDFAAIQSILAHKCAITAQQALVQNSPTTQDKKAAPQHDQTIGISFLHDHVTKSSAGTVGAKS